MVHYLILSSLLSHFIFQHEILTRQHDLNMQFFSEFIIFFLWYKMHSSALFFLFWKKHFSLHRTIGTETFTYISSHDDEAFRPQVLC